jgi:hypothetical protein
VLWTVSVQAAQCFTLLYDLIDLFPSQSVDALHAILDEISAWTGNKSAAIYGNDCH